MGTLIQQHIGYSCKNIDGCGQGKCAILVGNVGYSEMELSIAYIAKTGGLLAEH